MPINAAGARGGQDEQALGISKGGFSAKIHAKVDSFGLPLAFILTPGQEHKIKPEATLLGDKTRYNSRHSKVKKLL